MNRGVRSRLSVRGHQQGRPRTADRGPSPEPVRRRVAASVSPLQTNANPRTPYTYVAENAFCFHESDPAVA